MSYRQADLKPDGTFDYEAIRACVNEKTKLATIQRSKGYATRRTFSVQQIGELIAFLKSLKPDIICMVDNCYGEFVEPIEPSDVGADNDRRQPHQEPRRRPCSHLGGYICGRTDLVERCAYRLSAPGLGQEVGADLGLLPSLYQGFFLAPTVVASALKGAIFAANLYERLGFPRRSERLGVPPRHHSGRRARLTRGYDRLLQGHPVRRAGRQLCRPYPVGYARL